MRRADRLFQIIQLLRGRRRATTARWLAEQLEVSERTVYRDIRDLMAGGTPIEGEAGVGYTLRNYDLPPLMFDEGEMEALALGMQAVAAFGDEELARAAHSALSKVQAAVPAQVFARFRRLPLFVPATPASRATAEALHTVRAALAERRKLTLRYKRLDGEETSRVVRPLAAFFWGRSWTLTAWCEMRSDFRTFRLDRMLAVRPTDALFEQEPGHTLRDYLRTVGPAAERLLDG